MARIRSIKPEFPHSESMGNVSREARLCFILLWTIADDSGRLRGNSRLLASLLFPYDNDAGNLIDGWLSELSRENCIVWYEIEGQSYIQISNWLDHQKIDKPSASKLPECEHDSRILGEHSLNPRESSRILALDRIGRDRIGKDMDRSEIANDQGTLVEHSLNERLTNVEQPLKEKKPRKEKFVPPTVEQVAEYMNLQGFKNPSAKAEAFYDYYSDPNRNWKVGKNPMKDWEAAVRTWKRNARPDELISEPIQEKKEVFDGPIAGIDYIVIPGKGDMDAKTGKPFDEQAWRLANGK